MLQQERISNWIGDIHDRATALMLSPLKPGILRRRTFRKTAGLVLWPNVEVVPFWQDPTDQIWVLMTKRPKNDPDWPGMWHTNGSMIIASDTLRPYYLDALKRVLDDELEGIKYLGDPIFFGIESYKSKRGRTLSTRFWIELPRDLEQPKVGKLFRLDQLPKLPEGQDEMVADALISFRDRNVRASIVRA